MKKISEGWVTRNCHFIPQVYLKGFTGKNSLIKVYDKKKNITFTNNKSNIGSFRDLYNGIEKGKKVSFENYFTFFVDNKYDEIMNKIKKYSSCILVNKPLDMENIKELLSDYIANQMMRIPSILLKLYKEYKLIFDILDYDIENIFENKDKINEARNIIKEYNSEEAYKFMVLNKIVNDKVMFERIKGILKSKTWFLFKNESSIPFITSDNPVVIYNMEIGKLKGGIANKYVFIGFPLSSEYYLSIIPSYYLFATETIYGRYFIIGDESIETIKYWNKLQEQNCDRFTYYRN